jgi:hypothetical protein
LDDQLGAGLLNVQRAVQQLDTGEFNPGQIPLIGWDYGTAPSAGDSVEYTFSQSAGGYLSVTLAYDRPVFCTCGNSYQSGSLFTADAFPDLNLFITTMDGTIVASSTSENLTVEHIFLDSLASGQYKIVVEHLFDSGEVTNYGLAWWFGPPPGLAGDFNGDGNVNAADYAVWRKNGGSQAEYDEWAMNFGNTSGSGGLESVPEPSGIVMAAGLVIGGICLRRFAR